MTVNIVDDWLEQNREEKKDAVPLGEEDLKAVHLGLHGDQDAIQVSDGSVLDVNHVDKPGKLYKNVRVDDCWIGTQNLRKDSKNARKVKFRRRLGNTYDLTWVIHDDMGYVAKVETTDEGTTLEWL